MSIKVGGEWAGRVCCAACGARGMARRVVPASVPVVLPPILPQIEILPGVFMYPRVPPHNPPGVRGGQKGSDKLDLFIKNVVIPDDVTELDANFVNGWTNTADMDKKGVAWGHTFQHFWAHYVHTLIGSKYVNDPW